MTVKRSKLVAWLTKGANAITTHKNRTREIRYTARILEDIGRDYQSSVAPGPRARFQAMDTKIETARIAPMILSDQVIGNLPPKA